MLQHDNELRDTAVGKCVTALYGSCGQACVRRRTGTHFRSIGELIDAVARDDPAVPQELALDFGGSASRAATRRLGSTADRVLCPTTLVCCVGCGALWCCPHTCCLLAVVGSRSCGDRANKHARECAALPPACVTCAATTCAGHTALAVAESQGQILESLGRALGSNARISRLSINNLASDLLPPLPRQTDGITFKGYDIWRRMVAERQEFCLFVDALTGASQASHTHNTSLHHLEVRGLGRIESEELVRLLRTLSLQTLAVSTSNYSSCEDDAVLNFLLTESEILDEFTLEDFSGSPVGTESEAFRQQVNVNRSVRAAVKELHQGSRAPSNIWLTNQHRLAARHLNLLGEALSYASEVSFDFSGSSFAGGAEAELARFCRQHHERMAGIKLHSCTWEPDESGEPDGHISRRALVEISSYFPGAFSEQEKDYHVDVLLKWLATPALSGARGELGPWSASCPVLPKALSKCKESFVHLDSCGLSDECAPLVREGLVHNQYAEVVDLSCNHFTDLGVQKLRELVTTAANTRLALMSNCSCQATFVGEPKELLTALAKRNMRVDLYLTPSNLQEITGAWQSVNLDWGHQQTFRERVRSEAQVLEELADTELTAFEKVPNTVSNGMRLRKVIKHNWSIVSKIPVDLRVNRLSDVDAAELVADLPALLANLAPQFAASPVAVKRFNSVEGVGKRVLQAFLDRPGDAAIRSLLRDTVAPILIQKVVEERLVEPRPRDMTSDMFEDLLKFITGESVYENNIAKEQSIFEWQPVCGDGDTLDLSFISLRDAGAARLARALLAKPDKAWHVLLWGNKLKNEGALKLLEIMISTEHNIDMRWNPLDQDAVLEALTADPTRYAYLQSTMDPEVLKERVLARSPSSQKELAGRTLCALLQRPEEMDYLALFGSLEEEIQDIAWEEQRPLSRDQDMSNAMQAFQAFKLRQYSWTSFMLDTVLPVADVAMDVVQGLLYCIKREVQFLGILGFGCALNAVGTAHAAYKIKGSKRLALLNLTTFGVGGLVLETRKSKKTSAKTEMLFVYKQYEAVESSMSWATGCYSIIIAGFLKDYAELDWTSASLKWFSLLLSLATIPKLAFDLSQREAARGHSLRRLHEELRSTEGFVALFFFHCFDLASMLILFPFALSTRPIGVFVFLLVKFLAMYSAAVVDLQVPFDDAMAQAVSLMITNPAQSDPRFAAMSLTALQIRILSVVIAWIVTASKMYLHEKLALHLVQPGNACILLLAAVSLIGLLCCARFWWKRGFWAAARPQVAEEQGQGTLAVVGDDPSAEAPLLLAP